MSLRKQTLSGLIWTFTDTFLLKGFAFVASLILARILGPEEFGLIGMITVFVAIGTSLVDSGLSASIIRTKDADDRDFSTVFFLNLGMSVLIYALLYFSAPFIASFYNQEILKDIVRLYCLSFVISAFSAIQIAMLNRNMDFKKLMKLNIPGTIVGIIVGLTLGYLGYGVWSIVWMYLSTQVIQSLMLWITAPWKPSLTFDRLKMKYHYGFGYKLMLSGLLNTVFQNINKILIGKFYPVQTLGYYERAKAFNSYPVQTLTGILSKVTYPLLSKIQHDQKLISETYRKIIQVSFFITAPLMLGAAVLAKPIFLLVLGEQWVPAVPFFQIVCLSGMLYPIHAFNLNVFKVYGKSNLFLKLEIVKKIVTLICIIIGFQFGIYGLVWSGVVSSYIALLINTHYSSDLIVYTQKQQFLDMLPTLLVSAVMALTMFGVLMLIDHFSIFVQIGITALSGILIYFMINKLLRSESFLFLLKIIKEKKL